jgi:stress response protein YsnF
MDRNSALPPVIGAIVDDRDGNALGTVSAVYLDDATGRPTWVGLTDGLHAAPDDVPVIAPISDAEDADGRLRLTVSADAVRNAPRVSEPDRLTPAEEARLLEHYRAAPGDPAHRTDTVSITMPTPTGRGTATDEAMTRSEEQLQISTVVEPWTRAVLRIEEVTEEVMVPVTITRQQARIEYLPLTTAGDVDTAEEAAAPGAQRPTSTTGWVTLWSEQPTVTLERVPAERVRLSTTWAAEETTVSAQLRSEQVELTTTETTGF